MKRIAMVVVVATFIILAHGQGFGNLNFESAQNLPGNPGNGGLVAVTNALPNWTAYDGTFALSDIYYVSNNAGASSSVELEGGNLALSGNLSVGLYSDGSISQTGLVPADAESLEFEAESPSLSASGFYVILGGQNLSYSLVSESSGYDVYGANMPAGMDGQMEALNFGCQGTGSGYVLLDNIEFLTSSVPEPGAWSIIGVGAVLFGVSRLRPRLRRGMGGGMAGS